MKIKDSTAVPFLEINVAGQVPSSSVSPGGISPEDQAKLNLITVTGAIDLDAISASTSVAYADDFVAADFTGGQLVYTAAQHGKGVNPSPEVYGLDDIRVYPDIQVADNGDITITTVDGNGFDGKIIIP